MEDRRQQLPPAGETAGDGTAKPASPPADRQPPAKGDPAAPGAAEALTPEEQMERFERELKENDWGHQPC